MNGTEVAEELGVARQTPAEIEGPKLEPSRSRKHGHFPTTDSQRPLAKLLAAAKGLLKFFHSFIHTISDAYRRYWEGTRMAGFNME